MHDEAEIQAEKQFKSQYLVALIENKEDLDFTFEEWESQVIDDYLENMDKSSISEGKDIIIDGQPAKQYEIRGVIDRVNIAILATYIDGESHYAQILAWTLASKFKSSVEEFSAIVNTIRGL